MAFSDPHQNLERFGLHEGQIVADLGAGTGFYTIEAAKIVAEGGKVFAIDVQQDLLIRLKSNLTHEHLTNVELVHADIEKIGGTKIRDAFVDAVLMCNVFFQIEHKENFIKEVIRILKPGGRILFIDWSDSFGGLGPQKEHIVQPDQAREYFTQAGLTEISMIDAGDHHYGLTFRKS